MERLSQSSWLPRVPDCCSPVCRVVRAAVILTTNSWVGGKNIFLGALYVATGGVCLLIALFFFVSYDLGGRPRPPARLRGPPPASSTPPSGNPLWLSSCITAPAPAPPPPPCTQA